MRLVTDVIGEVRGVIRSRMDPDRVTVADWERLEAALRLLEDDQPAAAEQTPAPARVVGPADGNGAPRARRGENRQAIIAYAKRRPGATAAEFAAATGIEKRTMHTALSQLKRQGTLAAVKAPGSPAGYRLAADGSDGE